MSENKVGSSESYSDFIERNKITAEIVNNGISAEMLKAFKQWASENKAELEKLEQDAEYRQKIKDAGDLHLLSLYLRSVAEVGVYRNLDAEHSTASNSSSLASHEQQMVFDDDEDSFFDHGFFESYDSVETSPQGQGEVIDQGDSSVIESTMDGAESEELTQILRTGNNPVEPQDTPAGGSEDLDTEHVDHGDDVSLSGNEPLHVDVDDSLNRIGTSFSLSSRDFTRDYSLIESGETSVTMLKQGDSFSLKNSKLLEPTYLLQVAHLAKLSGDVFAEVIVPSVLESDAEKATFTSEMKSALLSVGFLEENITLPHVDTPEVSNSNANIDSSSEKDDLKGVINAVEKALDEDKFKDNHGKIVKAVLPAVKALPDSYSFAEFSAAVRASSPSVVPVIQVLPEGDGFGVSYCTFNEFSHNVGSEVGKDVIDGLENVVGTKSKLLRGCTTSFDCTDKEMMSLAISEVIASLSSQKQRDKSSIHISEVKNAITKGLKFSGKGAKFTDLSKRDATCLAFNIQVASGGKRDPEDLVVKFYNSDKSFKLSDVFPSSPSFADRVKQTASQGNIKSGNSGVNRTIKDGAAPVPDPEKAWGDDVFNRQPKPKGVAPSR